MKIAKTIIKSSELRSGNLLMSLNVCGGDHIYPIHGVFIGSLQMDEEKGNNDIDKRWEPVPLTPEILEKCGFEYRNDTIPKRWNKRMPGQHSTWYLYEGLEDGSICFSPHDWNYTLKLSSLHQLQNLYFALTQEELEISL